MSARNRYTLILLAAGLLAAALWVLSGDRRDEPPPARSASPSPSVAPPRPTSERRKLPEPESPTKRDPYVEWLRDTSGRVFIKGFDDGTLIFRKDNVQITVLPNGEELYLPDEI